LPAIPGSDRGAIETPPPIPPEFPKLHASPGASRVMMVTRNPSRWRQSAEQTPTMPAPMTMTSGFAMATYQPTA
jgi:hypothetical protein